MIRRIFLKTCACLRAVLAGLMGLAALAITAHAQPVAGPVKIIVAGIDKQIYLPAALADKLGYFKSEGLEVELLSDSAGVHAEDELLTGSAQGVIGFYDHTIALQAKGKFVQTVVQFSLAPGEAAVLSSRFKGQIRSPADFKGHMLGITGLGSSTQLLTQYLALSQGLHLRDLKFTSVGSGADFVSALESGKVSAGMTSEPAITYLLGSGRAQMLVDLRTPEAAAEALGGLYPGACLYMPIKWIHAHPQDVKKLARALVRSLQFIRSHSAAQIADVVPEAYQWSGRKAYVEALDITKTIFTADGMMPPEGPATVLKVMSTVSPALKDKPIDLGRTFSNEFVQSN